jgi:hypothetical protein
MRIWTFAPLLAATVAALGFNTRPAAADQGMRISGRTSTRISRSI